MGYSFFVVIGIVTDPREKVNHKRGEKCGKKGLPTAALLAFIIP